jgi:preprotein translocase subunit YajC
VTSTYLILVLMIGGMLLLTRSAKNKQRQATQMRDSIQPGSGVRTIGGMIALVKEVRDTTVLLEVAPGVHSVYAKNAIGTVLSEEEYERLVNNDVPLTFDEPEADAEAVESADAEDTEDGEAKVSFDKPEVADEPADETAVEETEVDAPAAKDAGKK